MTDLTIRPPSQFNGSQASAIELGKMLGLVAPITMSADQQTLWLASALDALKDIRPAEIEAVSMEVRRSVTRPSQIVPEIARLVAEKRSRQSRMREYDKPAIPAPSVKLHIADRSRLGFTADDWAELNEHLERMGATKRYRSDGTKYDVQSSAGGK
jgi:hypothetical protein